MYKLLVCVSSIVLCVSLFLLILFSQHCGFFKKYLSMCLSLASPEKEPESKADSLRMP